MTPSEVATLVDEHYGAMHRFARLVGRDEERARDAVRAAWRSALDHPDEPAGTSLRGQLLRLVLLELAATEPPQQAAPAAAPHELEPEGHRWAGWWKDDLPETPDADDEVLEAALASLPPALTAILVLRDVERLDPAEVQALFGYAAESQLAFLHTARTALRNALRPPPAEAAP